VPELTKAANDVLAERRRQVESECYGNSHDDDQDDGSLAMAAACYAQPNPVMERFPSGEESPEGWPWAAFHWKPTTTRRNLIKAGALILAEIERLDRAGLPASDLSGSEK